MTTPANQPDGLLAFLRAQIDEDERVAREGCDDGSPHWTRQHDPYSPGEIRDGDGYVVVHYEDSTPSVYQSEHIARHDPARELAEVAAKRAMLDNWQRQLDTLTEWSAKPDAELHAHFMHPDWEYATTEGQRKAWDYADEPPDGDGWVRNTDAGRDGWERFDYTEESYWRRLLPEDKRGGKEPEPPQHIRQMVTAYRHEEGYRSEWAPA